MMRPGAGDAPAAQSPALQGNPGNPQKGMPVRASTTLMKLGLIWAGYPRVWEHCLSPGAAPALPTWGSSTTSQEQDGPEPNAMIPQCQEPWTFGIYRKSIDGGGK